MWITSSYGIYSVSIEDMLEDKVSDYRLYTVDNGLTGSPTAQGYGDIDGRQSLYPGKKRDMQGEYRQLSRRTMPDKSRDRLCLLRR